MEFIIKAIEVDEEEYECPNPSEESVIIFKVEYIDGDDWDIEEMDYEGGAADYEQEFGAGLDDVLTERISSSELTEQEWYVVTDFYTEFRQDYYGEVDCDHYFNVRKASVYDLLYFGISLNNKLLDA